MNQSIKEYIVSISSAIEKEHFGDKPQELYEPIRYIMSLGGEKNATAIKFIVFSIIQREC